MSGGETTVARLSCQGCGADLKVEEGIRFLTCNYCNAKLEIVRGESTSYSRVLEKIAEDIEVVRLQNELERIDREWERERKGYLVAGNDGERVVPTKRLAGIQVIGLIVFAVVWVAIAGTASNMLGGVGILVMIAGLVFVLFGIVQALGAGGKADLFKAAEKKYRERRNALLRKIEGR